MKKIVGQGNIYLLPYKGIHKSPYSVLMREKMNQKNS